jgi:transposase
VVDIAQEKDIEVLRQVARLLDRENQRLHDRIKAQADKIATLTGDPKMLQRELIALQELLAQRERAIFGDSRDRRAHEREAAAKEQKAKEPRRGHGPKEQPELPCVEVLHDLDEADKRCTACGGELHEWAGQFEESEEIDVIERQFVRKKHKRKKYRCQCGGCVETALGPTKLRPGNRYSVEFAIEVAVAKYLDHLPLERQVRMMRRDGLLVDSQTLWDQLDALAKSLASVPGRILRHLLTQPVVGADETHWLMLSARGKDEVNKRWFVWSVAGDDGVVYRIFETRGHEAAGKMLGDYGGTVLTDGYIAYDTLKRKGGRFIHAFCWSHVRRKFVDAEKFYPREAGAVVDLIDELFAIERLCPTGPPDDPERLAAVARLRDEKSRWIVAALGVWGEELSKTALPESAIGKAASYMRDLWPGLVRFLADPRVPLSNNGTERSLRGVVLGRKNHYGSKSKRGTEVAALFYTLLESAKLAGLEPRAYLRRAVHAALRGEPAPTPHEVAAEIAAPQAEIPPAVP